MKYTINELIEIFSYHAQQVEQAGSEVENFNLPKALLLICEEIKLLKDAKEYSEL